MTTTASGRLGHRGELAVAVREAADNVRAALASGPTAGAVRVRIPLPAATANRFAAVTGGDPLLEWIATAAAAAVVLRRLGAGARCAVLTGEPLTPGLAVLVETRPELTFRELLAGTRAAVAEALSGDGVTATGSAPILIGRSGPDAALALEVRHGAVLAASDSVAADTVEAIAEGLGEVLRVGLDDPARTVATLGILGERTRERIIEGFNRTRTVTGGTSFRELLLEWGRREPAVTAVHDGRDEITYAQLCRIATTIGVRLRAHGVGADDVVALIAPRDTWFVAAAVGILFSGAAYLPIEPSLPAARRQRMLSGVRAVITTGAAEDGPVHLDLGELLRAARTPGPVPDTAGATALLGPPPRPHDLAYVLYTSGSTGAPKGASIEHHSFLNFLRLRALDCRLRPGAELPQTAPVSFDISVWQMFAPLTAGAAVCVVPEETTQDPAAMAAMIVEHGYEHLELVPTFISVLLDHLAAEPELGAAVRARLLGLISTGEVLGADLARRWNAEMPGVPLSNAYGPAECTDDVAQGPVAPEPGDTHTPVGRPLPNARLYVLDQDFQPVPPGTVGEIFVGGANVGRGYYRQPLLTAMSFLPDPFGTPGSRMYRTGDRGRWRPDGVLECLGRIDTQVKFRGRRIELGEITTVLEAHPEVALAAVELVRDGGMERLVGFAARRPGTDPRPEDLIGHLAAHLPGFMVPHVVRVLDELPCNQNGKVDHLALRRLATELPAAGGSYEAPASPLERELCAVLAEELKITRVGVTDRFSDLGGDSILCIRFTQRLRHRDIRLRPRLVLELQTVRALAQALRHGAGTVDGEGERRARTGFEGGDGLRDLAPLSAAQADFFRRDVPNPHHWNSALLFTMPLRRDLATIEAAVGLLVRRHPVLQTRFHATAEGLRQGWQPGAAPVTEYELTAEDEDELAARTHRLASELHQTLNLTTGPVCRVAVFRHAGLGDRVLLLAHHAVLDLFSWDVLAADLSVLLRDGSDAALPETGTSFFAWARRLAAEAHRDPDRWDPGYWLAVDAAVPPVLPATGWGTERDLQELVTTLDAGRSAAIFAARSDGVTVNERLTAALGIALAGWLGRTGGDVLLQLGGHGREDLFDDLDVSWTAGYFSTGYPFVLPLPDGRDPAGYTRLVAERLRAVPGRGLGFGVLRYQHPDPAVRARLDAVPAAPIVFDFLGENRVIDVSDSGLGFLRDATTRGAGVPRASSLPRAALLDVRASIVDGRISVEWLWSAEALPATEVRALAEALVAALDSGPAGPDGGALP